MEKPEEVDEPEEPEEELEELEKLEKPVVSGMGTGPKLGHWLAVARNKNLPATSTNTNTLGRNRRGERQRERERERERESVCVCVCNDTAHKWKHRRKIERLQKRRTVDGVQEDNDVVEEVVHVATALVPVRAPGGAVKFHRRIESVHEPVAAELWLLRAHAICHHVIVVCAVREKQAHSQ
jgi:hypothetical protein